MVYDLYKCKFGIHKEHMAQHKNGNIKQPDWGIFYIIHKSVSFLNKKRILLQLHH
jgi:hypothetical protein